jgi:catalase
MMISSVSVPSEERTGPVYTSSNGRPLQKPEQYPGGRNAVSLFDLELIEMLSHFNRERIPERVVHAKGAGAYGEFEVRAVSNS